MISGGQTATVCGVVAGCNILAATVPATSPIAAAIRRASFAVSFRSATPSGFVVAVDVAQAHPRGVLDYPAAWRSQRRDMAVENDGEGVAEALAKAIPVRERIKSLVGRLSLDTIRQHAFWWPRYQPGVPTGADPLTLSG